MPESTASRQRSNYKREHEVVLVDPGPLPHPLAASTDISKAVRAAYGADEDYAEIAERSIKIWRKWNAQLGIELYHEVGFLFMRQPQCRPEILSSRVSNC